MASQQVTITGAGVAPDKRSPVPRAGIPNLQHAYLGGILHSNTAAVSATGMNISGVNSLEVQPPLVGNPSSMPLGIAGLSEAMLAQSFGLCTADGAAINNLLLNREIPNRDFSRAINFEAIRGGGEAHSGREESLLETDDEEHSLLQDDLEELSPAEEQQQAVEQARLLSQFKQLRDWQQQQQQQLVIQQQQQLAVLRQEQDRITRLLSKQRTSQWGSDLTEAAESFEEDFEILSTLDASQFGQTAPVDSPRVQPQLASTIPAALGQGALSKARMNSLLGFANRVNPGSSQIHSMNGRPVPVLPERPSTPSEYLENGNPNLDSEVNTIESASMCGMDDDMFLAQESGMKLAGGLQTAPFALNFAAGDGPNNMPSLAARGHVGDLESSFIGAYSSRQGHKYSHMESRAYDSVNNGADFHPRNHQGDVLDFRESEPNGASEDVEYEGDEDDDDDTDNGYVLDSGAVESEFVASSHRLQAREDYLYGEEDLSDQDEAAEADSELEQDDMGDPQNLDELPVAGCQKTFEQLLEEQLRLEAAEQTPSPPSGPARRPFLKKGEGIARFNSQQHRTTKPANRATKPRGSSSGGKKVGPAKSSNTTTAPVPTKAMVPKRLSNTKASNKLQSSNQSSKPPQQNSALTKLKLPQHAPKITKPSKPAPNNAAPRPNPKSNLRPPPSLKLQAPVPLAIRKASPVPVPRSKLPSDQESVGDASFQICMEERAKKEVVEANELEDFEILEQFADDNASFLSNMSAVERKLYQEKVVKTTNYWPSQELRSATLEEDDTEDDVESLSGEGTESAEAGENSEDEDAREGNNTLTEINQGDTDTQGFKPQRKIAPLSVRSPVKKVEKSSSPTQLSKTAHLSRVIQFSSSDETLENVGANTKERNMFNTYPGTTTGHDNGNSADVHVIDRQNMKNLHGNTSPILDRNSNIKAASPSRVVSDIHLHTQMAGGRPGHAVMLDSQAFNSEDSSRTEAGQLAVNGQPPSSQAFNSEDSCNSDEDAEENDDARFDDDEEWDESIQEDSEELPPKLTAEQPGGSRKSAITITKVGGSSQAIPPPTSNLVGKLFPKLKQDAAKLQQAQQQQIQQQFEASRAPTQPTNDGAQSKALRDKLLELEREIEKFRSENSNLARLRKEREEGLVQMQREMAEFEKQKAEELQKIQEYKMEENKKLKREKKLFEQYQKSSRNMPDKKDREEIEKLKQQVSDLQDEMKRKDSRWTASSARLRDRIEQLQQDNQELREEIKILEKRRLDNWQQKETTTKLPKEEPVKKPVATQSQKSPRPEPLSRKITAHVNQLRLSSNHELDATEETESEVSDTTALGIVTDHANDHEPHKRLDQAPKPTERPAPAMSSPRKSPEMLKGEELGSGRSIPRKRAVPLSISNTVDKGNEEYEEVQHSDGKVEKLYSNGAREILFANGTRKQISKDGQSIIVSFFNGDMKQILPDQRVVYYYADAQTTHTTYPDGLEILLFPNQQTEKHYPDGTKEITFPDQTIKYLFPNGTEESVFPDGTVIRLEANGEKVMEFPNGQREVHTQQYKRREYPDGTVKTVYPDGRQETRYSSGRIRVKDKDGQIIVDKRVS